MTPFIKQLDALEALAKEATPGKWEHDLDLPNPDGAIEAACGGCVCYVQQHGNVNTITRTGEHFCHDDARYIAACNPKAIMGLVSRCRVLEEALQFYANYGPITTQTILTPVSDEECKVVEKFINIQQVARQALATVNRGDET